MQSVHIQEPQKNAPPASNRGEPSKDSSTTQRVSQRTGRPVIPQVDVLENEDEVLLLVDLPGVLAEDLTLDLEKETLTLRAPRKISESDRPIVYEDRKSVV